MKKRILVVCVLRNADRLTSEELHSTIGGIYIITGVDCKILMGETNPFIWVPTRTSRVKVSYRNHLPTKLLLLPLSLTFAFIWETNFISEWEQLRSLNNEQLKSKKVTLADWYTSPWGNAVMEIVQANLTPPHLESLPNYEAVARTEKNVRSMPKTK